MARLLYGTGMRISEALQLRVKDVDFAHQALIVREGKGGKDRVLMLPQSLAQPLRDQLGRAKLLWAADAAQQRGGVELPHALERKYSRAGLSWPWFWMFPQDHHSTDPRSGVVRRQHLSDQNRQRHTPCATAWPLTCCRTAMTSARFRNCWAIQMSPRP